MEEENKKLMGEAVCQLKCSKDILIDLKKRR